MYLTISKIAKQERYCKAIITIICLFFFLLSNGYCNKIENLKLFDTIINKDILVGKDIQKDLFSSEVIEEQKIRRYIFEFKFKNIELIAKAVSDNYDLAVN